MSRKKTPAEVREALLAHFWEMIHYWEKESRAPTVNDKMTGLVHSILVALDGGTYLPAFDLVCEPHPDDEQFHKDEDEDWYPNESIAAGVMLHDEWYDVGRKYGWHK